MRIIAYSSINPTFLTMTQKITDERLAKMNSVLDKRLNKLTIILDNVFDRHNISAVLRSCEAFGIQDVHIIETTEKFVVNREISHRCEKWLSLHIWKDFKKCADFLKKNGFTIYSTCFADDAVSIHDISIDSPIAIVVGNEHRGVDSEITELCDGKVIIPMHGFVQSLNVSVASAVALAALSFKLRSNADESTFITDGRKNELRNKWLNEHNQK